MFYSASGIFSKLASRTKFMSISFCFYYACVIFILGVYAIGWQQIIKNLPLTTAFANKAVNIVWGIVFGFIFFGEHITPGKIVGSVIVISGVILFVTSDGEHNE